MWAFAISLFSLLLLVVSTVILWRKMREDLIEKCVVVGLYASVVAVILYFLSVVACKATTGFMPTYSLGERIGYITKVSEKGMIFVTWEIEMQLGTGDQAALQAPEQFCVQDSNVQEQLRHMLGKKVVVSYRQWLVVPYRVGSASKEILSVTAGEEDRKR